MKRSLAMDLPNFEPPGRMRLQVPLLPAGLILVLLTSLLAVASRCRAAEPPATPIVSREVQKRQVQRQLKSYATAKDIESREQLLDETIERGLPFALALRPLVDREASAAVNRYLQRFSVAIEASPRIQAEAVRDSDPDLQSARESAERLARLALKLRDHLQEEAKRREAQAAEGALEPKAWDTPSISLDDFLDQREQGLVATWMNAKGFEQLTAVETAVFHEVNRRRARKRLPPLKLDYRLSLAARDHSQDMVRKNFFSHRSKLPGKTSFVDRARRMGTTASSENIASSGDAATAMSLWMASTGHRNNILSKHATRVGVGHVGRKFTLMFGR